MATFCKLLSDKGRVNWWKLCKDFGVNPEQPETDKRGIRCETVMESDAEISKLMQEAPNYTIDAQGRE